MTGRKTTGDADQILYRALHVLQKANAACVSLQPGDDKPVVDSSDDLRQIAVMGEASLRAIEVLKSEHRAEFDPWYRPFQQEIDTDDLMRYFRELRNLVLKEGWPSPGEAGPTIVVSMDSETMEVAASWVTIKVPEPPEAPTEHHGEPLTDGSLEKICRLYVANLWRIYDAAVEFVAGLEPVGNAGESS